MGRLSDGTNNLHAWIDLQFSAADGTECAAGGNARFAGVSRVALRLQKINIERKKLETTETEMFNHAAGRLAQMVLEFRSVERLRNDTHTHT